MSFAVPVADCTPCVEAFVEAGRVALALPADDVDPSSEVTLDGDHFDELRTASDRDAKRACCRQARVNVSAVRQVARVLAARD